MSARRSIVTLSAEADRRYMYQMRKDGYCPLSPPPWLDLLGWTATALVFGSLAVIAYNKKVERRCSATRRQLPPLSLCQLLLSPDVPYHVPLHVCKRWCALRVPAVCCVCGATETEKASG